MPVGIKFGGRKKGTPNKSTIDIAEKLAALSCDPIEGMALIANDVNAPLDLRGRMYSELAQYIHAKRKAVEVTGADGGAVQVETKVVLTPQ